MSYVGLFLGGSPGALIASGQAQLNLQWQAQNREDTKGAVFTIVGPGVNRTVKAGQDGRAYTTVPVGSYTVSVTHTGAYSGDEPLTVDAESQKSYIVFFDGIEMVDVVDRWDAPSSDLRQTPSLALAKSGLASLRDLTLITKLTRVWSVTSPGTYSIDVPKGTYLVHVTGARGGRGGNGAKKYHVYSSGEDVSLHGGKGGEGGSGYIFEDIMEVGPGDTVTLGVEGTDGKDMPTVDWGGSPKENNGNGTDGTDGATSTLTVGGKTYTILGGHGGRGGYYGDGPEDGRGGAGGMGYVGGRGGDAGRKMNSSEGRGPGGAGGKGFFGGRGGDGAVSAGGAGGDGFYGGNGGNGGYGMHADGGRGGDGYFGGNGGNAGHGHYGGSDSGVYTGSPGRGGDGGNGMVPGMGGAQAQGGGTNNSGYSGSNGELSFSSYWVSLDQPQFPINPLVLLDAGEVTAHVCCYVYRIN